MESTQETRQTASQMTGERLKTIKLRDARPLQCISIAMLLEDWQYLTQAIIDLLFQNLHARTGCTAAARACCATRSGCWSGAPSASVYPPWCLVSIVCRKNIYQTATTPNLQNLVTPLLRSPAVLHAVYCSQL